MSDSTRGVVVSVSWSKDPRKCYRSHGVVRFVGNCLVCIKQWAGSDSDNDSDADSLRSLGWLESC